MSKQILAFVSLKTSAEWETRPDEYTMRPMDYEMFLEAQDTNKRFTFKPYYYNSTYKVGETSFYYQADSEVTIFPGKICISFCREDEVEVDKLSKEASL